MADSPLTSSLVALSRFFVGDGTLEETLSRVADLTIEAIPPADLVGITLPVDGRKRTAIFTDPAAPEIDQAQYDSGEGPCLAAFEEIRITMVESTLQDGKWPAFRQAAIAHGVRSTMAVPLVVDKLCIGALNLYSRRERAFGEADTETAMLFGSQAAIVLANAQAYWDARKLTVRLGDAMDTRAVIEQAKGILMGIHRCDADEAFQLLVQASQRENVKLRTIAQRLVDNTTAPARRRPGPTDAP
jgi:GAF domain-containing protein